MQPIGAGCFDKPAADLVCIAVEDKPAAVPEREIGVGNSARLRVLRQPGAVGLIALEGAVLERDLDPALNSSSKDSVKARDWLQTLTHGKYFGGRIPLSAIIW